MNTPRNILLDGAKQLATLTERQREVATLACQGLSNKIISAQLGLCEGTIKIHLHAIYGQLGVHSRAQLIAFLADRGAIEHLGAAPK
jgi:DNA-binding NarL/FixJ family response regulator